MDAKGVLKFLKLESISEHLSGYVEDRIELLKLELQEDAAAVSTKVVLFALILIFGLFCLLFLSIALAIIVNNSLGDDSIGYLIVGGVYLIFTLVAFVLKNNNRVKSNLYKKISRSFGKES